VSRVAVVPVDVVDVVQVGDGRMAAADLVHVHVPGVRDVPDSLNGLLVDVIAMDEVDVAVVEIVHVVLVRNGHVPAETVVEVRVRLDRMMRGFGHRFLRGHGSPTVFAPQDTSSQPRSSPDRWSGSWEEPILAQLEGIDLDGGAIAAVVASLGSGP
jgi:hypothetical protein